MLERPVIIAALDCASKINDDGAVSTVLADADKILDWYALRLEALKKLDPLKDIVPATPQPRRTLQLKLDGGYPGAS